MSYGHVRYLQNCPNAGLLLFLTVGKMGKNFFSLRILANYSNTKIFKRYPGMSYES